MAAFATILAQLHDNADYDSPASVTKARLFRTACRQFLTTPSDSSQESHSTSFDLPTVKGMLDDVNAWLNTNDTSDTKANFGAVTHVDLAGFRS